MLSKAIFQLVSSEQSFDRVESDGDVKMIRYVVNGGGGGRGIDRGGPTRVGRVERCVNTKEMVDTVGDVLRSVCVKSVVRVVTARRVAT